MFSFLNVLPMLCDFQGLSSRTGDTTQATGHESTSSTRGAAGERPHAVQIWGNRKAPSCLGPQFAKVRKKKGQNQDPTPKH